MINSLNVSYRQSGLKEHIDYHSHQEYEIYFFHAGVCRYLIHNQIYDLEPGDILLMDGLTLHRPNIHPHIEYVRSVVHFTPQMVQDVLKALDSEYLLHTFEQLPHCFIRTKENKLSKELEEIIYKLVKVNQSSIHDDRTKESQLKILIVQALMIVYQLTQRDHLNFTKEKGTKAEHAENIATFIQDHYMKKLTLDSIADALNLSKSYISHLFKEMTGFTIMDYVMECRLIQAKYLLEMEPEKPIKDVAHTSGFESSSHFSRYFRSKVGKTAREYRNDRLKL